MKKLSIILFFTTIQTLCASAQQTDTAHYKTLDPVTVLGNKNKIHRIGNSGSSIANNHLVSEGAIKRKKFFFYSEVPLQKAPVQLKSVKIKVAELEENVAAFLIIAQKDSVFYNKEIENSMITKKHVLLELNDLKLGMEAPLQIGIQYKVRNASDFKQKIFMSHKSKFKSYIGELVEEKEHIKVVKLKNLNPLLIPNIQFELEYKQ